MLNEANRCLKLAFQEGLEALGLRVLGWGVGIRCILPGSGARGLVGAADSGKNESKGHRGSLGRPVEVGRWLDG